MKGILTDEEIKKLYEKEGFAPYIYHHTAQKVFARDIEKAIIEKLKAKINSLYAWFC